MKLFLYITLFFSLFSFSCDDYLDQYPTDGLVLEEFWQNKEDLYNVLNGAYGALAEMDITLFLNGEIRADMIAQGSNLNVYTKAGLGKTYGLGIKDIMEGYILATNAFAKWDDFYEVINYCNYVIKYAPVIKERDNTFTDFYMQAAIAEATTLRSLMYFYLVRIYKDVPYVTWPTESDAVDLFPFKSTSDEILDQILEDLVDGKLIEKLPDYYGSNASTKGRMNRYAAYAMIADMGLWRFDYDLAITYIEKIENSGQFDLVSGSDWYNLFAEGNLNESLFEVQMSDADGNTNLLYHATNNLTKTYFIASRTAYYSLVYGSEKTRGEGSLVYGIGAFNIYKYLGTLPSSRSSTPYFRAEAEQADANFIIYRYADVMLMKAEALTQKASPEYQEAFDLINRVRTRAGISKLNFDSFSLSQQTAGDYIMDERALELAYEGKRWFDLLRYGRRNDYAQKDQFINLILVNVTASQKLIMASKLKNSDSWYLPIHQDEVDYNRNLDQNPYYITPDL